MIFDQDPLDSEEPFDDYIGDVETKLEHYIESGRAEELNLLKQLQNNLGPPEDVGFIIH